MKRYSFIKIIAAFVTLLTAVAFSCEDHNVPDPDPVSKCNRIDGTPRAFPCEFQVTKIEILTGNTSQIAAVITPQQAESLLSMSSAVNIQPFSGNDYFRLTYKSKVYVKRIADSPNPTWNKYDILSYEPSNIPEWYDLLPNAWSPSETDFQEIQSWAIGETKAFDEVVYFYMGRQFVGGGFTYSKAELLMTVLNYNTSKTLFDTPYSYRLLRDVSEAYLRYFLQMKE